MKSVFSVNLHMPAEVYSSARRVFVEAIKVKELNSNRTKALRAVFFSTRDVTVTPDDGSRRGARPRWQRAAQMKLCWQVSGLDPYQLMIKQWQAARQRLWQRSPLLMIYGACATGR